MDPFLSAVSGATNDHSAVHIVGIGGSATRGMASLLQCQGVRVSGSDQDEAMREWFSEKGIAFHCDHDAGNIPAEVTAVVHSRAVGEDNPEIIEAQRRGIPIYAYSEYLGRLGIGKNTIAVSGTHGKTSTTALLLSVFLEADQDPSLIAGGDIQQLEAGWRHGEGDHFLVEACEFQRAFLDIKPEAAIITNIDLDHPEIYSNRSEVVETFRDFISGFPQQSVVVCSPEIRSEMGGREDLRWVTCGRTEDCDVRIIHESGQAYSTVEWKLEKSAQLKATLQVPGDHSVENATKVVALCHALGISPEHIQSGLEKFQGVARRFESREVLQGTHWIEDYAHHPQEVEATLRTAQSLFRENKIHALFQPHQAGRLSAFMDGFSSSFQGMDEVFLLPIYSVRENISDFPEDLLDQLRAKIEEQGVHCKILDFDTAPGFLAETLSEGDVLVSLGAGNVDQIGTRTREIARGVIPS